MLLITAIHRLRILSSNLLCSVTQVIAVIHRLPVKNAFNAFVDHDLFYVFDLLSYVFCVDFILYHTIHVTAHATVFFTWCVCAGHLLVRSLNDKFSPWSCII
jgi:hypothetical protein